MGGSGDYYGSRSRRVKFHTDRYRPARDTNSYTSRRRDFRSRSRHRSRSPRNAEPYHARRNIPEYRSRSSDVREDRPNNPSADLNRRRKTPELPSSVKRAQQLISQRTMVSYMDLYAPRQVSKLTLPSNLRHPLPVRPPRPVSYKVEPSAARKRGQHFESEGQPCISNRSPEDLSSLNQTGDALVREDRQTSPKEGETGESQTPNPVEGVGYQPSLSQSEDTAVSATSPAPSSAIIAVVAPEEQHNTINLDDWPLSPTSLEYANDAAGQ
ncbi:hypothetical protein K440DRAFT_636329 [Wilcoxina mikolae CBS 423.85]|nr:hypothetical protein K440DRAFT_636329 [Wilcoxina mikolae CBS 423.85]